MKQKFESDIKELSKKNNKDGLIYIKIDVDEGEISAQGRASSIQKATAVGLLEDLKRVLLNGKH